MSVFATKAISVGLVLFAGAQIVLYGALTEYESPTIPELANYQFFPDIHVMIFVGFGFLMAFLKDAGFTATSHAFFVAAYSVLWGVLNRAFWKRAVLTSQPWDSVYLSVPDLIGGDFVAGAVLISMGALLGRVTLQQLALMSIIEVVWYAMNEASIMYGLQITDAGGTYYIHMFGAYFGLTASAVLGWLRGDGEQAKPETKDTSATSEVLSMVGTLFLFVYWPSWNAAGYATGSSYTRAIINTYLSIVMSTIAAFLTSIVLDGQGRLNMREVQRATLAGGVAMGAAGGMVINPVGALVTGLIVGIVSVLGFRVITPRLNAIAPDTCGVHNLHGLPALIGAVVSAIGIGAARYGSYEGTFAEVIHNTGTSYKRDAGYQMVAIFVTLGFALTGGVISGLAMSLLPALPTYYDDRHEYNVPHAEAPTEEELKEVAPVEASHDPSQQHP